MKYALHYYDTCPFCQRVLAVLPDLKVPVEKRNVMQNRDWAKQQAQGHRPYHRALPADYRRQRQRKPGCMNRPILSVI